MSRVTIEYLKQTLDIFFESSQYDTKKVKIGKRDESQINLAIYELENYLYELKQKNSLNLSLNADISSKNIRASFQDPFPQAYTRADYEYNFLLFLAYEYKSEYEIRHYIQDFIEAFKENLTWIDLVITETRATRAFTNIRFAVDSLRKQGLLYEKSPENDGLHPTLFGLIVLLHTQQHAFNELTENSNYPFLKRKDIYKSGVNSYLYESVSWLTQPENTVKFCNELVDRYGDKVKVLKYIFGMLLPEIEKRRIAVDIAAIVRNVEEEFLGQHKMISRTKLLKPFVEILKTK